MAELQGISEGLLTDEQTYGKYLQELEAHKEDQGKLLAEAEEEQLALSKAHRTNIMLNRHWNN